MTACIVLGILALGTVASYFCATEREKPNGQWACIVAMLVLLISAFAILVV